MYSINRKLEKWGRFASQVLEFSLLIIANILMLAVLCFILVGYISIFS